MPGPFDRFGPMAPGGAPNAASPTRKMQTDEYNVSGGAYPLTKTPDGYYSQMFLDGIQQSSSTFAFSGSTAVVIGISDFSIFATIRFVYSYYG